LNKGFFNAACNNRGIRVTRSQRYATHLRLSKNKATCVRNIQRLTKELSLLPREVAIAFDSAFGLDKNLEGFLQSNFGMDISKIPNKNKIISDLLSGTYENDNPVLSLNNGDLVADQIAAYASVSSEIRESFNIELDEAISATELLPFSDDFYQHQTYFTPLFDSQDDVYDNMHLQVDVYSSMLNVNNTNVFARTFSSEIKDVKITLFENNIPAGVLSANFISFTDECIFSESKGYRSIKKIPQAANNATLMADIEMIDESLVDILHELAYVARKRSFSAAQKPHLSIASDFVAQKEAREGKNGILHIRSVDIEDCHKLKFTDILNSLCILFSDHGNYDVETYKDECEGFNALLWASLEQDPKVSAKRDKKNNSWMVNGISAITANAGTQWWHDSLSSFNPDFDEDMTTPYIFVENSEVNSESPKLPNSFAMSIEDLLIEACSDKDKINMH